MMNRPPWINEVKEVTADEAQLLLDLGVDVYWDDCYWDSSKHFYYPVVHRTMDAILTIEGVFFYIPLDGDSHE